MAFCFGIDASSFQGNVNWGQAAKLTQFGAEKVTQGTGYLNPYWNAAKVSLLNEAKSGGFVPIAYLFMDAGPGGPQADYFARQAGDLSKFAIAVDFERGASASPTLAQAQQCTAEVKKLFPGHPIGGYAPHWFTGGESLGFFDWLWASSYVNGSGSPAALYQGVPASWWASYGGKAPLLLQFTNKAVVPGVSGPVDCSAFRGSLFQLAQAILPKAPSSRIIAKEPEVMETPRPASAGGGTDIYSLRPNGVVRHFVIGSNNKLEQEGTVPGTAEAILGCGWDIVPGSNPPVPRAWVRVQGTDGSAWLMTWHQGEADWEKPLAEAPGKN